MELSVVIFLQRFPHVTSVFRHVCVVVVCWQIHLELLLRLGQDLAVVFASKPLRSILVFGSP